MITPHFESEKMMEVVGRIVARGEKIAGIFMPMGKGSLDGIYNVVEIMGELQIKRVGAARQWEEGVM